MSGSSVGPLGVRGGLKSGNSARNLNTYPHQFFDLSSQEVPRTVKELFRFCLYLFMSHSEIAPVIKRKCQYILTDLVYDTESKKDKEAWQEMLEDIIDIKGQEERMLLDYEVYGNSMTSIAFPFTRNLVCPSCKNSVDISEKSLQWHYRDHKFVGVCVECKKKVSFDVDDRDVKRKKSVKLIRWLPEHIQILQNPITMKTEYFYKIPRWMRKRIKESENDENRYLVEDMPMVFLEAVKKGHDVKLDPNTFYHMRTESCSQYDETFGMPPMLPIFKDAWLHQTYRRAQEAIAMEHVLPLRLLIPRAMGGDHSPHMHNDLGNWSFQMQNITSRWRRDPNAMFTVPFPCEVQNIGGDAQALNVHNDMLQLRQTISAGLDLPLDLMSGSLSFCLADHGLVPSSKGLLSPLELIEIWDGEKILMPGHTSEMGELTLTHDVGDKELLEITTGLGSTLKVSRDHKVYTLNTSTLEASWTRAEELSLDSVVGIRKGSEMWGDSLALVLPEQEADTNYRTRVYQGVSELTEDLAACAGLIIAEGTVTDTSRKVMIETHDPAVMEDYRGRMSNVLGRELNLRKRHSVTWCGGGEVYAVSVERKEEVKFLKRNVGTAYSSDKRVPLFIRKAPREYVVIFLRYLFEGAGCYYKQTISYDSISQQLVEDVQALLLNMGIVSTTHPTERDGKTKYNLSIRGNHAVHFVEQVGFVSSRKLGLAESQVLEARTSPGVDCEDKLRPLTGALQDLDMIWLPVKGIQSGETVPMYDFTIKGSHSFLVNGCVTHNSGSSVSLRMLENAFLGRISGLEKFLNKFLIPKLKVWAELPEVEIRHKDFKMADDAQQKQIALSLRQTNTLSDRTVIQELGFDYATEQDNKRREEDDRNNTLMRQMESQAQAQGKAQIISAEFQAQAQIAAQKASEKAQRDDHFESYDKLNSPEARAQMSQVSEAVGSPSPEQIGGSDISMSAEVMNTLAENIIKSTPPGMEDETMQRAAQKSPQLAAAIQRIRQRGAKAAVTVRPNPTQKPSTAATSQM